MKTIITTIAVALLLGSNILAAESSDLPPSAYVPSDRQEILTAAARYGADAGELLAVAKCESSMDPRAVNGNDSFGILQFEKPTFYSQARLLGIPNPDIWSVPQQAAIAASMFARGQQSQWSCYTILRKSGKL